MNKIIKVAVIYFLCAISLKVTAEISETAKVDMLLIQAKTAYDQQDYKKTISTIEQALNTKVAIPESVYYVYADSLSQTGEYQEAKVWLEKYVNQSGREGVFYNQALERLINIDDKIDEKIRRKALAEKTYKFFMPSMITIPNGHYRMGGYDEFGYSMPVTKVSISSFKIMETEVTWALYQPCIDDGACPNNDKAGGDQGWGKENRPVINISFEDIQKHFIPWINKKSGQTFRLPSEAEWEYAARSGVKSTYYWGGSVGNNNANCGGCISDWDGKHQTAPVKSFNPNKFGLYDMLGNIQEWTQDCWNDTYKGSPKDNKARVDGNCNARTVRGGGFNNNPEGIGVFIRTDYQISYRGEDLGFRLVQDIVKK